MRQLIPPSAAGWTVRGLWWHGGVLAGALLVTLLAWWPVHDGWFLLDDYRWLIAPTGSWEIFRWFTGSWGHGYAYRPLARVSFLFDLRAFGWNPIGWHLHSDLLQAINVWLLFALIWTVTARRGLALASAALFAVSPLSHENVAWISGRTFLLGGFFFLASLNLLARAFATTDARLGQRYLAGGVLLFAGGLASYEAVIVLPLVVAATLVWFPHLAAPGNPLVRRGLIWLFGLLPIFILGRMLVLKGGMGVTTPTSPYWLYAPIAFYWRAYVAPAWTPRVIVPVLLAITAIVSLILHRVRPSLVPAGAARVQAYLVVTAFILFLPFSTVTIAADRFLYLVQLAFIGTIVLLGYAVARLSRIGLVAATAALTLLVVAGLGESRALAAEWAAAGRVNKVIADTLYARYPVWPAGTDIAIAGVPPAVGSAPVYVLYDRESVLRHYLFPPEGFDRTRTDAQVYLTHRVTDAQLASVGTTRPAKFFQFDMRSCSLTELSQTDWSKAHGSLQSR